LTPEPLTPEPLTPEPLTPEPLTPEPSLEAGQGTVVEFDYERGLGMLVADDGRRLGFHCTAVADGSRRVEAGARVVFEVMAGRRGRWEATAIRPLGDAPSHPSPI